MNKIKILIIDNEEDVLRAIKNICQEYDVTTVTSSLKAVEIMKYEKFDIFIVDYQMPQLLNTQQRVPTGVRWTCVGKT